MRACHAIGIALLLALGSTQAQDAPDETLSPVLVTATKEKTPLGNVAGSVAVVRDTELRATNISDLEALSDALPNTSFDVTPTNTYLFIRGLGTGEVRSAEQSVGLFVDGIYFGRPQLALFDFLDLEQVEVLRGPQGALLGKNTIAGAINLKSAAATFEPSGYLEGLTGSDDNRRLRGAISGPLGGDFAGRIAFSEVRDGGYLPNTTLGRADLARPGRGARGKVSWQPEDADWRVSLTANTARIRQRGDGFKLVAATPETLALYRRFDAETEADPTRYRTATDNAGSRGDIDGEDFGLSVETQLGSTRLQLLGGTSRQKTIADFDADFGPAPILTFPSVETYQQSSIELRSDTPFAWGNVRAGYYRFDSQLDLAVDIRALPAGLAAVAVPLGTADLGGAAAPFTDLLQALVAGSAPDGALTDTSRHRLDQQQQTDSLFASAEWKLTPRSTLRADGRYTRERKRGVLSLSYEKTGVIFQGFLGESPYDVDRTRVETDFSPRLSALFKFQPRLTGFITYGQGFKSGGFNNIAPTGDQVEFDAERSESFEFGARWRPKGLRLQVEATAFRTAFDDLQVAVFNGTNFFVDNAAKARSQGVELSGKYLPFRNLAFTAAAAYLDARYERFANAPAPAGSTDPGEDPVQDLSGRPLVRAPNFSGSFGTQLDLLIPGTQIPLVLGATLQGMTKTYINIDLDEIDTQGKFVRTNAFVVLASPDKRWRLSLIGRNLTGEVVRRESADVPIFTGSHFGSLDAPRTLSAELGYRF